MLSGFVGLTASCGPRNERSTVGNTLTSVGRNPGGSSLAGLKAYVVDAMVRITTTTPSTTTNPNPRTTLGRSRFMIPPLFCLVVHRAQPSILDTLFQYLGYRGVGSTSFFF